MPRYFFNMVEGCSNTIVEDREGITFTSRREIRQEAIDLAIDIANHKFQGTNQTSQIVVTDTRGNVVLTVALASIRFRKIRSFLRKCGRFTKSRTGFDERAIALLIISAALAVAIYMIATTPFVRELGDIIQPTSASRDEIILVRFVPQASMAAVTTLLRTYKASFVNGPTSDGLYRLRINNTALQRQNLPEMLRRMAHEKIVMSASAAQ